ncbi:MAG TPA: hypothetical protein VFY58_09840 [Nocardioides sp.]|nr:hypothetical protein [Nocardioides sp.]
MSTGTIVLIIVIVLVVLALIGLFAWLGNRKKKVQRYEQAESLRKEAVAEAGGVHESHVQAREAEAKAEKARLEAARAEEEAARAHQGVSQEQALHEQKIREADRLDPHVDHKSEEYSPDTSVVENPPPAYDETGRVDRTGAGTTGATGATGTTGTTGTTGATGTTAGTTGATGTGAVDHEGRPVDEHGRLLDEHGRPIEGSSETGGTHRAP